MSQPDAVASASLARSSPRCQPWSSRLRLPSGSSRLWSGPATKPSSEIDMWQGGSGIGVLPRWLRFADGDSTLDPAVEKSTTVGHPDLRSREQVEVQLGRAPAAPDAAGKHAHAVWRVRLRGFGFLVSSLLKWLTASLGSVVNSRRCWLLADASRRSRSPDSVSPRMRPSSSSLMAWA